MSIILSVEDTCDIPFEKLDKMNVKHISLTYRNETTGDENPNLTLVEFYDQIRKGNVFKTSLINQYEFEEYFRELVKNGDDVLHLAFTGALSGTCKCAMDASEVINKEGKGKVKVVDTLTGSGAQAIILLETIERMQANASLEELANFAEEFKSHVALLFTPEDMKTLSASGRLSKITALLGTILNIKPIIYCNDEGKFSVKQKVMSRKKALQRIVELFKEMYNGQSKHVYILHGDKLVDAEYIKSEIESDPKYKDVEFHVEFLGKIVGAHGGPGNICICFSSEQR